MESDAAYYRLALRIFADFSGTIAIPAVLAAILGELMDIYMHTPPLFLLLFLTIALLSTIFSVVKKALKYQKEYDTLNRK